MGIRHHSSPGRDPVEVESLIAEPIEQVLRESGQLRSIESSSLRGVSLVFVRLTDAEVNVSNAWSRIQDKLTEVTGKLPPNASTPILTYERHWDPIRASSRSTKRVTTTSRPAFLRAGPKN